MNKRIIAAVIIVAAVLTCAYFFGGDAPKSNVADTAQTEQQPMNTPQTTKNEVSDNISQTKEMQKPQEPQKPKNTQQPEETQKPNNALTEADAVSQPTQKNDDLTCTLSVKCDTVLSNLEKLSESKRTLVPKDGIIYSEQTVSFHEGESVFDVLQREMKKNGIHIEFEKTPAYKSVYIEGINNLYEFDCGELSGWSYRVNGSFPGVSCSQHILSPGDRVELVYTCSLGRDTGGYNNYSEDAKQ